MKAIYLMIGMAFTGLLASSSVAQQRIQPITSIKRDFVCFDTEKLVKELVATHKETPLILGKADDQVSSTMSMWVNPETRTWTLVATLDNISCVIGSGTEVNVVPIKKGTRV